jgi:two-component system, response regulator
MFGDAIEDLLVEDEPEDVDLTLRALQSENLGNGICVARDREQALDFVFCRGAYNARAKDAPPRLILLDLKLPKVDGLQVLRELKSNPEPQSIPVVILTSSAEERDIIDSYKLGVNSYILKPADISQFRQAVETLGLGFY